MEEHRQALRRAVIVTAVVLAVTVLLVVLFLGSSRKDTHESITLPDAPVSAAEEEPPAEPEQNLFAEITRENVQDVLRSLARPSSYYQKLTILNYADGSTRQQQADIWRSGELLRADVSDETGVKSILTDGKTLYVWYDGDETPLSLPLRETMSTDELIGIPTYETILSLDPAQIGSSDFVTLEDQSELACIYVSFTNSGCTQYYWVDVASGLLCRQTMLVADAPVYTMQQIQLDILIDGDETLSGAFCLPDGSEPFSQATTAKTPRW